MRTESPTRRRMHGREAAKRPPPHWRTAATEDAASPLSLREHDDATLMLERVVALGRRLVPSLLV